MSINTQLFLLMTLGGKTCTYGWENVYLSPPPSPKGEAQAVRNPQIATTTQFLKAVDWRASHIRFFAGTVSPLKIYVLTVVF